MNGAKSQSITHLLTCGTPKKCFVIFRSAKSAHAAGAPPGRDGLASIVISDIPKYVKPSAETVGSL